MSIAKINIIFIILISMIFWIWLTIPNNMKMAQMYFDSYNFEKSYHYINKEKSIEEENINVLIYLKKYFEKQGDLIKSASLQEKVIKLKPKNVEYIQELARIYLWSNKHLLYTKTRELELNFLKGEKREKAVHEIAHAYKELKKFSDANRLFKMINNSKNSTILREASWYFLKTKQIKKAIKWVKRYLYFKNDQSYRKILAELYEADGNNNLAIENYLMFIEPRINNTTKLNIISLKKIENSFEIISKIYKLLNDRQESEKIANLIFNKHPSSQLLAFSLADMIKKGEGSKNRRKELFKIYKQNQGHTDKNYIKLKNLAIRFSEIKYFTESIKTFLIIQEKGLLKVEDYKELAGLYQLTNNRKKALYYYYEFLKLKKQGRSPSSLSIKNEEDQVKVQISTIHLQNKEYEKSLSLARELNLRYPNNISILEIMHSIYYKQNKVKKMKIYRDKILKIKPYHQFLLYSKIFEYSSNGKQKKVLELFKNLKPLKKHLYWNPDYTYLRFQSFNKTGNFDLLNKECSKLEKQKIKKSIIEDLISIECLQQRPKDQLKHYQKIIKKHQKNIILINAAISKSIQLENINKTSLFLEQKERVFPKDKDLSNQKDQLEYLKYKEKIRNKFYIEEKFYVLKDRETKIFHNNLSFSKTIDQYSFGLHLENFKIDDEPKKMTTTVSPFYNLKFSFVDVYLSYKIPLSNYFIKNSYQVKLTNQIGDLYYLNLSYLNNEYEFGDLESLNQNQSSKKSMALYVEVFNIPYGHLIFNIERKKVSIKGKKIIAKEFSGKFYTRLFDQKIFKPGFFVDIQKYNLTTRNFTRNKYLGIISNFQLKTKKTISKINIKIGGDIRSEYKLGEIQNYYFSWARKITKLSGGQLYLDINKHDYSVLKLGFNYNAYL